MEKKYVVVRFYYCGLIGIETEMSRHSTTKAAWRAYHKYVNQFSYEGTCFKVLREDEKGKFVELVEMKMRNDKGRWVTV